MKGIAECEVNRPGLGSVTYSIVNKLQETFSQDLVKSLNTQFMLQVLRMVAARLVGTGQHKAIEELMVFEVLDGELLSFLSKENVKIY